MTDVAVLVHADAQWEARDGDGDTVAVGAGDVLEAADVAIRDYRLRLDRILEGGRATYWTTRP